MCHNLLDKMKFIEKHIYHIYNRGNNREPVFFRQENYIYFLKKVRKYIRPYCDILSYCLMPNHFHFLIFSNCMTLSVDEKARNNLSNGFKLLLSSYAKAINKQEKRTGSLFTQNTHSKVVSKNIKDAQCCFLYIHQNPLRRGLVKRMEDWCYSSFRDYCNFRKGTLCNKQLACEVLSIELENLYAFSNQLIPRNIIDKF